MSMIADLFVKLTLNKKGFDDGIDGAKQKTSAFGGAMSKLGGMVAGVFAVSSLVSFGRELVTIATQAEGVQAAFKRIGGNGSLLDGLRNATKGTVTDLELMKRSVMASNFKIPIESLASLFQFATKRSQETGQSVDYLVDSIVLGIGRKSPLILDNLGISAIELRQELKGAGVELQTVGEVAAAVGRIAASEMRKSGEVIDTFGIKVQSLGANWGNLKLQMSSIFSNSQWLSDDLADWSKVMEIWQNKEISGWKKFLASFSGVQMDKVYDEMKKNQSDNEFIKNGLGNNGESSGGPLGQKNIKQIETVTTLKAKLETLNAELELMNINDTASINIQKGKIRELDAQIKSITDLAETEHKTAVEKLADLKKINDELEAQRILEMEFYGEGMTAIPTIGAPDNVGATEPDSNALGNMNSHNEKNLEDLKNFTEDYMAEYNSFISELNSAINDGIGNAIASMASGLGELFAGEIGGKEFGMQILQTIGQFMQTLGGLLIAYAINMALFAESAKNPLAWPVALGAGIALVAAGAAISGFASKGLKGSSSGGGGSAYSGGYSGGGSQAALAVNVGGSFELHGTTLKAAIHNTDRKNNLIR